MHSNVVTRSKVKRKVIECTDENKKELAVIKYVKIIESLKTKLESKEKLNDSLLEEQENNSKEFEKLCKEVNLLKKRVFDEETKNSELLEENSLLRLDNANLIKEQEECGYMTKLTNLKTAFELQNDELMEMHLKYTDLIASTANTKKGYNINVKTKPKYNSKKYNAMHRKMAKRITLLSKTKKILNLELDRREASIITLRNESEKLLDTIYMYDQDLKQNQVTLEKIAFLENRLLTLQELIEKNINKKGAVIQPKNTDTTSVPHSVRTQAKEEFKKIYMFSDITGKSMSSLISEHIPETHKIINLCKVGCEFTEIINEEYVNPNHDEAIVIMIGNYKSVKRNFMEYIATIDRITKEMKKLERKVIVTTLLYGQRNDVNTKIFKVNSKLYTLASLHSNLNIIEINNGRDSTSFYSKNGREAAAKYIASAFTYGVNRSNLTVLPLANKNELNTSPVQNFLKVDNRKKLK